MNRIALHLAAPLAIGAVILTGAGCGHHKPKTAGPNGALVQSPAPSPHAKGYDNVWIFVQPGQPIPQYSSSGSGSGSGSSSSSSSGSSARSGSSSSSTATSQDEEEENSSAGSTAAEEESSSASTSVVEEP